MRTAGMWVTLTLLLALFLIVPVVAAEPNGTTTYSLVHLSDTQNLATRYPGTYDFTFSYLEGIKAHYNISAIIITGDLVNTWNKQSEWEAYAHARNKTTIPVYVVSGNHDTNSGKDYTYYSRYTGEPEKNYVTTVEDFDLIGINYVSKSLPAKEFTRLRLAIDNSTRNFTIIATHYYMNEKGTHSRLGKDIDHELVVQPTLILSGHIHAYRITLDTKNGYPVIEDLTNYQNGEPGWQKNQDYSAGTLYTVTAVDGQVVKITSGRLRIYPTRSPDDQRVLYTLTGYVPHVAPGPVPQSAMQAETLTVTMPTANAGHLLEINDDPFGQFFAGDAFRDLSRWILRFP
jgi:predicted MPP superfamily phosphohydrolase